VALAAGDANRSTGARRRVLPAVLSR